MSYRPNLVFCAPIETVSGYGSHARDILLSLIEMDKFNIKVISINWGDTPMNALDKNNPEHKMMLDLILDGPMQEQPDVWMQCTIPNEFQKVGKYNIGITAGVETDIASGEWVEGCNRMDLIIVPSKHSKYVFENSKYEKRDKNSHNLIGSTEITVPIEVLHEGIRTEIYNKVSQDSPELNAQLNEIKENFCFLFVGHWLKGDFGEDRKDISGLIYTFYETFGDTVNPPALVLKSSSGNFSITDRSRVVEKINLIKKMSKKKNLPNVYVLHGDLTDTEMNSLYNHPKIKAFVSFTKGEGYGRPIAEFMASGKPILVSGWSGHTDFITDKFHTLLKGELKEVHHSAIWETVINKGSKWFTVNYKDASSVLYKVHTNYNKYLNSSKLCLREIDSRWSYDSMHNKFKDMMEKYIPKFAQKMALNLPTLKKIDKPDNL